MTDAVAHGGIQAHELRALGLHRNEVIDFSASVSPLGPPPGVRAALMQLDLSAYPDPDCLELREAIATREEVAVEQVLLGNGSVELIHLLAQVTLRRGGNAGIFTPSFGEYEWACRRWATRVDCIRAVEHDDFRWPRDIAHEAVVGADVVLLGNPNNPTGVYLSPDDVESIAGSTSGLLILDEAYRPFVESAWDSRALLTTGHVVLLRSLTKDFGLAGLRLGYCIAPPTIIAALRAEQVTWSVSAAAQVAGMAALADSGYLARVRQVVRDAKALLCAGLTKLGLPYYPGAANFVLVRVGDARALRSRLLRQGLVVRDCASFGLPAYIRVGVRTAPECLTLVRALGEETRHAS